MAQGTPTSQDQFKLKSVIVPEETEQTKINKLISPKFSPEQRSAFGAEFSDENISKISERLQKAAEPRFARERARLSNLLSATGSLQGTPLALARTELAGQQQSQIAAAEADLFRRQAEQQAADRRAAEGRLFSSGEAERGREFAAQEAALGREFTSQEAQIARDFNLDLVNLKRDFQLDDREFAETTRKLDTTFRLIESGQIDKNSERAVEVLSSFGISDPSTFLSSDEAEFRDWATAQGLSVDEAKEVKRLTGQALFQDIQSNPERYADLAVDPQEALRQSRIDALLARGTSPENITRDLAQLEDAEAVSRGEAKRIRLVFNDPFDDDPFGGTTFGPPFTRPNEEADRLIAEGKAVPA